MPTHFDLIVTANSTNYSADLRLIDADGVQLGYKHVDFNIIPVSHQQGLFDLRNYLRHYVDEDKQVAAVAEIGICIAQEVLGQQIFQQIWQPKSQRTLRVQLPGAAENDNVLTAALARVPWEIARPTPDQQTLAERNLVVRVVHDMQAPVSRAIDLASDEPLRILFVFAESRGARPLGARLERRALLNLFEKEIYPQRRIVAHFLTHGVTRQRLEEQVKQNSGYHVVHWSGHGHLNLLELAKPGGTSDRISGQELLDVFTDAGGFLPRLFFLSACHSGDILRVKDWNDFLAIAQGKEPASATKGLQLKDLNLLDPLGYTGTAHALLQGGVPSVVAMRYAVGDDYARELTLEFYRALFAHAQSKSVATALTMARQSLRNGVKDQVTHFAVCDHATPLLYGEEQPGLTLVKGISPAKASRDNRVHRVTELSTESHAHFVGRTWELAGLGADFIGSRAGMEVKPIAVLAGLGGMGKTALTAEALELWGERFEWVLLYQAKPNALGFDATLRDFHVKLSGELGRYHDHVKLHPSNAIYRDASAELSGTARFERLTQNLIRALKDESILLVLDNFETNLKPQAEATSAAGEPVWSCQDPAWDACLATLAKELVGSSSRVIITCRRPLAALAKGLAHQVVLGPLPATEAALFLKEHPGLRRLFFGSDAGEKALAVRLLNASRFHPLLMDRLALLATQPALRPQFLEALDILENAKDFAQLPEMFNTKAGDEKELAYLEEALTSSLDQLIDNAGEPARRLLWIVASAIDSVTLELLKCVWSGKDYPLRANVRRIKQLLDSLPQLSPEEQNVIKATPIPLEAQVMMASLPPENPVRPEMAPLLLHLINVGLIKAEYSGPEDANPNLVCHELVRERIHAWMAQHPHDHAELTENTVLVAYAGWLNAEYENLRQKDMDSALQAGSRALIYCVQAGAWEHLSEFASRIISRTSNVGLLRELESHLRTAATAAPEGPLRWRSLGFLADALSNSGRPDASLPFYEQAAAQALVVAEEGGEDSQWAWSDVTWITRNWLISLKAVRQSSDIAQRYFDTAMAKEKTVRPAIYFVVLELEILRNDIQNGDAKVALPKVESHLAQVETWWEQHRAGVSVPEAPDEEVLAHALITALNVARAAHFVQDDWEAALRRIDAILKVELELRRPATDIASTRMIRAMALMSLNEFKKAQTEIEDCLPVFENDHMRKAKAIATLAKLFEHQGDTRQAVIQERRALALMQQLPDPVERAKSHGSLALMLETMGTPSDLAEALQHQLAALVYFKEANARLLVKASLSSYGFTFFRAYVTGIVLVMPRVADLLNDPTFDALKQWLEQRQVDVAVLQANIDQSLELVRKAALPPQQ